MDIDSYEALRMDFKNLMSCIHYHGDSDRDEIVLETLKTIVDICSHESCGKDAFREAGGLDFLIEFLLMTDNTTFLEHTLKTLAFVVDENVHSQMLMSKKPVFDVIQTILQRQTFPLEVWKNALLLISTILYHNSTAQSLALEIGLIQDLMNVYENCAQSFLPRCSAIISTPDRFTVDLWFSTNSALCFAVNNPQNEKNQEMCMNIFPVSLKILEFSPNTIIMNSISSFLSLTISNNGKCQDYFSSCDGFLILKRCLQKFCDALFLDLKLCNNVIGKENPQAISSLIAIISAALLSHEKNAVLSGKLSILSMMIKLIFVENLDCQLKTKIILCLGHSIDACCDNKSYVLETENFDMFLKKNFCLDDAELSSACKYLVHVCLINKGSFDADGNFTEHLNFAPPGSIKEKCIPELSSVCSNGSNKLNKTVTQTCSSKRNSMIGSTRQSPKYKIKNDLVKPFEAKSFRASSSNETSSQPLYSRRKSSVVSRMSHKKPLYKKEHLSCSNTITNGVLSNQTTPTKCDTHLSCINSYRSDNTAKYKTVRKGINSSPLSNQTLNKQNTMPDKIPFTDFLMKKTKYSASELQNQSKQCDQSDCSVSVSDKFLPQFNKSYSLVKENNGTLRNVYNPFKADSFSQNGANYGYSHFKMKPSKQNSLIEGYPKHMKKNKMYSKRAQSETSCSYNELSFCPQSFENLNDKENSKFGLSESATNSFDIKNCDISDRVDHGSRKRDNMGNMTDTSKIFDRKPLISSSSNFQNKNDYESNFALKLSFPASVDCGIKNNVFPKCNEALFTLNSESQKRMKNINTLTSSADDFSHLDDELVNRFSFSRHASDSCGHSVSPKNFDECHHSSDKTIVPRTFNVLEDKLNKRKQLWDCPSKRAFNEDQLTLQSSSHVEVIELSEGTCAEHGLSSTIELLEVVSLDEFNKHSPSL